LKYGGASAREMAEVDAIRQATANFMLNLFNFSVKKLKYFGKTRRPYRVLYFIFLLLIIFLK